MKIYVRLTQVALSLASCCCLAAAQAPPPALSLPAGTAIPITFPHTLDAAKLKVGDAVTTKTDQVILGSGGAPIPRGSQLMGSVVEVQPSKSSADPSELAIKFETLKVRDQVFTIHVALRALASFVDSYSTRSPAVDNGYPESSVYRQVGGDYFYPDDVVYSNDWDEVGKSTHEGVFVKLEGIQLSKSRNHVVCDSTNTVQAVGVFASGACGVYGFMDLTVVAAGSDNSGAIRFASSKHTVKIASGSSALLQVVGTTE
jgi:hypothetical protein